MRLPEIHRHSCRLHHVLEPQLRVPAKTYWRLIDFIVTVLMLVGAERCVLAIARALGATL